MISVDHQFSILEFWSAFHFHWDPHFAFTGEQHVFWEIVLVLKGKVTVTEDEKLYTLSENQIIFHGPMEFHRIASAEGTCPEVLVMSFLATGQLPEALKDGVFTLRPEQIRTYREIFQQTQRLLTASCEDPYQSQETAQLLAAFLIQTGRKTAENALLSSPAGELYRKLVQEMHKQIAENRTLEQLAASCGVSVSYMKLLFQQFAGMPPKTYYNRLRLQEAQRLLVLGKTVREVAETLNFSSASYFASFYKRMTDKKPSQQTHTE